MKPAVWTFPYQLPRNAFTFRDAARAGDLWRGFQDVAVFASSRAGWPPQRFRASGTSFVVAKMTVVHHRETSFGEALEGQSWVRKFRRGTLCTREVRLMAGGEAVVSGTQEWVHVDDAGKPTRASSEVVEDFTPHEEGGVEMPAATQALEGPERTFTFAPWHTWMDPLDHVNHPQYVDFADEATARALSAVGASPLALVPLAETVRFKLPIVAGQSITLTHSAVGRVEGGYLLAHRLESEQGVHAEVVTARAMHDDADGEALAAAYGIG